MPNPLNRKVEEQWDNCQVCGFLFPMSKLHMQKGRQVCTRRSCTENLEPERHQLEVMRILGTQPEVEGADSRWVNRAFFDPFEEQT